MARPNSWMEQYCHGLRQEVFPLILPECFHREGLLYEQVRHKPFHVSSHHFVSWTSMSCVSAYQTCEQLLGRYTVNRTFLSAHENYLNPNWCMLICHTISQVVELAYCQFGIILFGLDIATMDCHSNQSREILLCPFGRLIQLTDVGLVIAKNLETAELLSKFGQFTTGTPDSYKGDKSMPCFPHRQRKLSSKASEEALLLRKVKAASGGASQDVEASPARAKLAKFLHPRDHHHVKKNYDCCFSTVDSPSIDSAKTETISACCTPPYSSSKWGSYSDRSLEEAVDIAMSWPPVVKCTKPEQPVLERQTRRIFENLAERTLSMVKLQKAHILLCIQGTWPVSLFYFIEQLRKPIVPNPPVVILHPNDPKASDWGCVGLFEHVYFVKGSPIHELDLVRAGVLKAGAHPHFV